MRCTPQLLRVWRDGECGEALTAPLAVGVPRHQYVPWGGRGSARPGSAERRLPAPVTLPAASTPRFPPPLPSDSGRFRFVSPWQSDAEKPLHFEM